MPRVSGTVSSFVRRFGALMLLSACAGSPVPFEAGDIPLRNPTVPIAAITRFDLDAFSGSWVVRETAGGDWRLQSFDVASDEAVWNEIGQSGTARGRIEERARGILRLAYEDGRMRDVWVLWIDPDHGTAALGSPDGDFGFVATRVGRMRPDQIAAAREILDFNGYRTAEWQE